MITFAASAHCLFIRRPALFLLLFALSLANFNCQSQATVNRNENTNPPAVTPKYGYQIVNMYPHDERAFTQGLLFAGGQLLESTGQEGKSSLRRVDLESGRVLKKVDIPSEYFGEGLALLNGKLYQLTWQHQVGFIYDGQSLEKVGQFTYSGEGWGLTTDGKSLILSDGSNRLRFINPDDFKVTKTITVLDGKTPVDQLNELEYVHGEIYANVWHEDRVATINPETGKVTSWIDLSGLLQPGDVHDEEAVLNGIAYDSSADRLFVTGKLWPRIYEIKIKK
jgi:glutamine cyclotransferase